MKQLIVINLFILLAGCATPAQRFDQQAQNFGFQSQSVRTEHFQHKIYTTKPLRDGDTLHVYLDGDGTPWERNRWVAEDPTARNPLILRLMQQDKAAAILLGRPCYYGLSKTLACNNKYWTSHRYSKTVVDSMAMALNIWLTEHDFKHVVVIGYSGGGAIAVLMADKIKKLSAIVTVAANLNVAKWSEFHGYVPLKNSLNPADFPDIKIKQIHFAGKNDEVVPAFIIKEYAAKQKHAKYYEFAEKDHACCWDDGWDELLSYIK